MNDDLYFCPLVEMNIHNYECIENCDCIDGYIKISSLPDEYKRKSGVQRNLQKMQISH